MAQFFSTYLAKLDAKNRTSVPAAFRTILKKGDPTAPAAMVLRSSHQYPCIEVYPLDRFAELSAPLDAMDTFGEDQDDFAFTLFPSAHQVEADKDGRIILPDLMVEHANLKDEVAFMGFGKTFHIWEPVAGARAVAEAQERSRQKKSTLPGRSAPS